LTPNHPPLVAFFRLLIGIRAGLLICWQDDMEKGDVKLMVFNDKDFGYWKNRTRNYLLSHGRVIWEIV
jgi:hypothetical protein